MDESEESTDDESLIIARRYPEAHRDTRLATVETPRVYRDACDTGTGGRADADASAGAGVGAKVNAKAAANVDGWADADVSAAAEEDA